MDYPSKKRHYAGIILTMDAIKSKHGKIEPVELSVLSRSHKSKTKSNTDEADKSTPPLEVSSSKYLVISHNGAQMN